jgi:hypothetical protein
MLGNKKLEKIALWYMLLQAIIWIKSALFFAWFGYGRAALFNIQAFTPEALAFNFWFHEAMHLGIAVLALLFGKNLKKLEGVKLAAIIFVAVGLHNLAYWFTRSHPSMLYNALDFVSDSAVLLAVVVAGFVFKRFLNKQTFKFLKLH